MNLYRMNLTAIVPRCIGIVLLCTSAFAVADPSYDHIEIQYTDANEGAGNGLAVSGSHRFNPNGFMFADYSSLDVLDRFVVGGGYIHWVNDRQTVDFTVAYEDWTNGADDSALVLGSGIRYDAFEQMEVNGGAAFYGFDRADNDLALSGGVTVDVTPRVAATADLEYFLDSGFRVFRVGGQIRF